MERSEPKSLKQIQLGTDNSLVDIRFYTDPLCCWSWAFDTEWTKIKDVLGPRLSYRYVMGGLIPGWSNYQDRLNEVTRPAQMGPLWMHVAERTGKYVDASIWTKDAPASSYPACMAVKCAELQQKEYGEVFLRHLRKAVFEECRNVAKYSVLKEIAEEVKAGSEVFSVKQFDEDMNGGRGLEVLRADIEDAKKKSISRFPALLLKQEQRPTRLVQGFKTCEEVLQLIGLVSEMEITV